MFYVKWLFRLAFLIIFGGFLHYTLPTWDIVRIVNTEVQRVDFDEMNWVFWAGPDSGTSGGAISRDVRFIETQRANGREMVYRNEDTGLFGWPPFFKINSADVQARASALVSIRSDPEEQWVAIKHYGWRSTLFSSFPNALRIKEVEGPEASVTPWISIAWLVFIGMVFWALYARWRRFWAKRVDPAMESVVDKWEGFDDDIDGRRNIFQRIWVSMTGRRGASD